MRVRSVASRVVLACTIATFSCLTVVNSEAFLALGQGKPAQLNISPEEQSLAKAIIAAPDPAAKLKAAATLIEKHPKTLIRPRVARALADQIANVTDASQKITLAQDYQKLFKEPSEQDLIMAALVDGYARASRSDEAFEIGTAFLARQPDSLSVLVTLTFAGNNEAKKP